MMIADEVKAITGHLHECLLQPRLAHAVIVIIFEANLDGPRGVTVCHEIQRAIDAHTSATDAHSGGVHAQRTYVYTHDAADKGRPGVWVDNAMKEQYVKKMTEFLNYGNVSLFDPFIGREEDVFELRRQMLGFRRVKMVPKTPFGVAKWTYSGKGNGCKDDRVMSLLMGVYHAMLFFQRDRTRNAFGLPMRIITGAPNALARITTASRHNPHRALNAV